MTSREKIIQNYIDGYNHFDIDQMVIDFDNDIIFQNIEKGEVNLVLNGKTAFRLQAEKAANYFSERKQTINSVRHFEDSTEIEIDYYAVLAMDFPNGLSKGQKLNLTGKSIFVFHENTIIQLTDIS